MGFHALGELKEPRVEDQGWEDPIHRSMQAGPCQGQGWAVPSSSFLQEVVQPPLRLMNVISLLLWNKNSWFILGSFGGTFWVPSGNSGQPSCQRPRLFCQLYKAFAYRVSEGRSSASLGALLQLPHGLVECLCPVTFERPSSPGIGLQALLVGYRIWDTWPHKLRYWCIHDLLKTYCTRFWAG